MLGIRDVHISQRQRDVTNMRFPSKWSRKTRTVMHHTSEYTPPLFRKRTARAKHTRHGFNNRTKTPNIRKICTHMQKPVRGAGSVQNLQGQRGVKQTRVPSQNTRHVSDVQAHNELLLKKNARSERTCSRKIAHHLQAPPACSPKCKNTRLASEVGTSPTEHRASCIQKHRARAGGKHGQIGAYKK